MAIFIYITEECKKDAHHHSVSEDVERFCQKLIDTQRTSSFNWAFVAQPQTNGVVERYNRTLKEQAIYGRIFRNVEEVRAAVKAFVERYNEQWLIEKMGFRSPNQARREYALNEAA